jgi:5-amino-6-(5-phospho-D-ribitylamino)uracil phosphatase
MSYHKMSAPLSVEAFIAAHPQRPPIRLAFFDIDGTLLGLDGDYTQRLADTLARVRALGVKTAIASGRPAFATRFLWDGLGLHDMGVFCTGAQIMAPGSPRQGDSPETIVTHSLDAETLQRLLAAIRQSDLYYELYTEDAFYIEAQRAPEICAVHAQHLRVAPRFQAFESVTEPVIKLLIGADCREDAARLARLEAAFPEVIFAYAALPAYPDWQFASLVSRQADKTQAFGQVLQHYGLAAENVISFGDAQSDAVFLSLAGIGVAMGNASDAAKNAAKVITRPVWDDGVAWALERLVLGA